MQNSSFDLKVFVESLEVHLAGHYYDLVDVYQIPEPNAFILTVKEISPSGPNPVDAEISVSVVFEPESNILTFAVCINLGADAKNGTRLHIAKQAVAEIEPKRYPSISWLSAASHAPDRTVTCLASYACVVPQTYVARDTDAEYLRMFVSANVARLCDESLKLYAELSEAVRLLTDFSGSSKETIRMN